MINKYVEWKSNPKYIYDNLNSMFYFEGKGKYLGPAKMLVAGKSNRFKLEHYNQYFPNLTEKDVIPIEKAGHWVHLDNPDETIKHVIDLLEESK